MKRKPMRTKVKKNKEELAINMHSGSVTASGRHENGPSKRQKSSEGQDMISNLPDFIIGYILSFLPTKDAVRTSALSQRWIYMWTFVTELSFRDKEPYYSYSNNISKTSFLNFVCRVLLHLNSASIQKFSLFISEKYDPYHINQWISAVLNRRVQKISVHSQKECNLSSYPLFKCQSLEELVLVMDCCCSMTVSTFVCLSSLTVLNFTGITFTCYSSNKSKELTFNFPVLREYEACDCTWSGVKSVTLEAPLLEVISLKYDVFSRSDESHAEIKFCASHLTKFSYRGSISSETILLDAHIAYAGITLFNSKVKSVQKTEIFVRKLLSINAECLELYICLDRQDLAGVEHYLADIPAFGMLGHLQLNLTGEILLGLLLKSPRLETLVLKMLDFVEEPQNFAIVPDCFLSTLKVVKFKSFAGDEHELRLAKFVMENAQVLERISFSCCQELCGSKLEKVKEKLFLFKRSFSIVIIEFSSYEEC